MSTLRSERSWLNFIERGLNHLTPRSQQILVFTVVAFHVAVNLSSSRSRNAIDRRGSRHSPHRVLLQQPHCFLHRAFKLWDRVL